MMDQLDHIRTALADRYTIGRVLGSGGMATVFLARDLKHERDVAVKVLRPELAAAIGSDRFLREIRITAQLNHPHVLPLLDSGEAEGLLYYVMPYVAGGSLRMCLNPETPLQLEATLHITRQVASALDYAHRYGVIHRDIKPENILFSEGHAVVADFGIAKAVSAAGQETLTRTGVPLGTPGYMGPEQAMGVTDLDERTDVYSLACVVYEMLIGVTPAVWPSEEDVRLGRLADIPAEQRARLDVLPGRIEQALAKALALRPADRFATPGALADALTAAVEGRELLNDAQVRVVLERAAQLQAERPTEADALSVGAVEQVAAQVGIPPARVREAVRELERPQISETKRKKSDAVAIDRVIDGEVPESAHRSVVKEIESALGIVGHISTLGDSLTWSPAAPGSEERKIVVTVTPEAGRTRIHIEERWELSGWRMFIPAWGTGIGILSGLGISAALGMADRAMLFTALGMAALGGFTAVQIYLKAGISRRQPQLAQLADRLTSLVERVAPPAS
jgi:serine/threonine protein kinase